LTTGTATTQRTVRADYLKAGINSLIDTKLDNPLYTEISYNDWLQLTPYQQEHGRWDVTDVPGADGTVSIDLMTKLWENPSPTSSFAAQNITLSSDDYDMLMYVFKVDANTTRCCSEITMKGFGTTLSIAEFNNTSSSSRTRYINYTSDTVFNVSDGYINGTKNNSIIIPYQIYGIKTTASVKISAIAESVSTSADKCMLSDGETSVEDALNGFKFYPTGTSIVGLVSDNSPYTDANGNYVLANSTTGQSMIDDVTYKSIASTEDTRGMVGADSATPFKSGGDGATLVGTYTGNQTIDVSSYKRSTDTADNFLVEWTGWKWTRTGFKTDGSGIAGCVYTTSITNSLSGNNLTVTGAFAIYSIKGWDNSILSSATVNATWKLWHV
jgi:hypothetical protein